MAKKKLVTTNKDRLKKIPESDLLKTGSTVLDYALSGRRGGGFAKGKYFWIVGDSSSGKTFLTLTCLAEASINPNFDDYRLIYDNVEDGALMDIEKYFGSALAERIEAPAYDDNGDPSYSLEVEDFYYNLDTLLDEGQPFIYILDSMDSLDSKYAESKFKEAKKAHQKGTQAKGDYGDGKAKINSTRLRRLVNRLSDSGSMLIILSQTRDNINAGMFEEQQTHAGGRALKFYATAQLWSSVGSKIKKEVNGKDHQIGVNCRVRIKKNRLTGKERAVEIPIYYDFGFDDIGSMVDYLVEWQHWSKSGGFIDAGVDFDGVKKRRKDLISYFEDNDLLEDLEDIVHGVYLEAEKRLSTGRTAKYS